MTAAVAAAVMFYFGATLPAPPVSLDGPGPALQAAGAYHVHSARSADASGSVEEIAAAAARAGLRFVILTDHGDGTRPPDPPTYRSGVLLIDAVELSTGSGHVVALGLSGPAAYPLAGQARDVVNDIHRLGGAAVLAHPDSPRSDIRWRGANAPFDGIEWLNADSEWRDESAGRLVGVAARSLIRPAASIASLFNRPARTLSRWDAAAAQRSVFGLAALDVHARIGRVLEQPSHFAMFQTVSQVVLLDEPLSGDAAAASRQVLAALTEGRSFSLVRAAAEPADFEFRAERGDVVVPMGGRLPPAGDPVRFYARIANAPGVRLVLQHNGRPVAAGHGTLDHASAAAGVYRVEAMFPGAAVPWLMSNPIVVGSIASAPDFPADDVTELLEVPLEPAQWTIERDAGSAGQFEVAGESLRFDFRLGGGAPQGQYAALVNAVRREGGISRIQFVAHASTPMRVSVQVKLPGGPEGERWRQSAFIDMTSRLVSLRLAEFEPADAPTTRRPNAASLQSLLFVVDTVNTKPGTAGTLWISDVRLGLAK